MEIKDYVKQFRDLQKSHKKVRVADFCRENMVGKLSILTSCVRRDCYNGMNNQTFDKGFWKSFSWFLLIAAIICCLPWILAKHSWIDFTDTGQIGDTIGGIMGPFVAIAAAGLTFIAFWVQYKANIQQRHDIAIERFESNLFEMIHIQQEIINGLLIEGNLRCELLASDRDRELYSKKLSPNYSYQEDEGRNMDMEYKKSAFVNV